MGKFVCSASVMCANLRRLEDDIAALEAGGVDELHFDIVDGLFVPSFTLGFDLIKAVKSCAKVPCNAHLMVTHPEQYIERFADAGCDSITVHQETCPHANRTLAQIRDAGASPGIALNPATPLMRLDYLLPQVDRVLLMTVDPGCAGQKIIPSSFERVRILHENIQYRELPVQIEVDGNISVENSAKLMRFGAEIFVLGTASIFKGAGTDFEKALPEFREAVLAESQVV